MERIYIIRHRETWLNLQGVLQGWGDEPLNDNGIRLTEIVLVAEKFFKDPFSFPLFPEGENLYQVCARTQAFLKELCSRDDGKTYLFSTYGCDLQGMLNYLYDNKSDYWHVHVPYNCVVNIVEVNGGKTALAVDDRIYYDPSKAVDQYTES